MLDESHNVKDASSQQSKACSALESSRRWCVTGTPIAHNMSDLSGQAKFLRLDNVLSLPKLKLMKQTTPHSFMAILRRVLIRHAMAQKRVSDNKTLLELPPKTERTVMLSMTTEEAKNYKVLEKKAQDTYLSYRNAGISAVTKATLVLLSEMIPMRKLCSGGDLEGESSSLNFGDESSSSWSSSSSSSSLSSSSSSFSSSSKRKISMLSDDDEDYVGSDDEQVYPNPSREKRKEVIHQTKIAALIQEITAVRTLDSTSKCLVFSQFKTTLATLASELPKHGFSYRTLQGNMTQNARAKALRDFQNDPPTTIFLLSVRAGSVGINLTQANHVFLMEPLLNPALELQAVGRVHRMGQSRPVVITKLVMKDSVEERMMKLQASKKQAEADATTNETLDKVNAAGSIAEDKVKLKINELDSLFDIDSSIYAERDKVKKENPKKNKVSKGGILRIGPSKFLKQVDRW